MKESPAPRLEVPPRARRPGNSVTPLNPLIAAHLRPRGRDYSRLGLLSVTARFRNAFDQTTPRSAPQDVRLVPPALHVAQEVGARLGQCPLLLGRVPQARAK
jgi:hypothetical protein